jgi:acyl carrier protein
MNNELSALELIEKAVSRALNKNVSLQPEHTSKDVPGWDSLNNVKILIHLEMLIGRKINEILYFECKTVGELVTYIDQFLRK